MADLTKDSYDEANRHQKVLFQRAKDVIDFELNEAQDITRFQMYRMMADGVCSELNPGSNDDGYLAEGTGAVNQVTLRAGTIFCDGIPVVLDDDTTLTMPAPPGGGTRTDTIYLTLVEVEIADPNVVPQLGETTRRRKLSVTANVTTTTVPADSVDSIQAGGSHNFPIATVLRTTGVTTVAAEDVTDVRFRLPPTIINLITQQYGGASNLIVTGNWLLTVGNGTTSFGDFNGEDGISQALDFLAANSVTRARVFIKSGFYTVTDATAITFPVDTDIVLEGETRDAVIIENQRTASFAFTQTDSSLLLKNMTLMREDAIPTTFPIFMSMKQNVVLEDVVFIDTTVFISNPIVANNKLVFRRCSWRRGDISDESSNSPVYILVPVISPWPFDTAGEAPRYVFEDCYFQPGENVQQGGMVHIALEDDGGGSHIGHFEFTRCTGRLAGTSAGVGFVHDGNNPGVLTVNLSIVADSYVVDSIKFIDCDVIANHLAEGEASVLFYNPTLMSRCAYFEMKGGRWLAPHGVDAYVTPLFLGGFDLPDDGGGSSLTPIVMRVEDVDFGFIGVEANYPPGDTEYGSLTGYDEMSTSSWTYAFCFSAIDLNIKNIRFYGATNQTGAAESGDLWFGMRRGAVDGVKYIEEGVASGGTGYPTHRIYCSSFGGSVDVRFSGVEIGKSGGAKMCVDNGSIVGFKITGSGSAYSRKAVFSKMYLNCFAAGDANRGIMDADTCSAEIVIEDCHIIEPSGEAIYIDDVTDLTIRRNTVKGPSPNGDVGGIFTVTATVARVQNNSVSGYGAVNDSINLQFGVMIVTDNYVNNGNMCVGNSVADNPVGVVQGNVLVGANRKLKCQCVTDYKLVGIETTGSVNTVPIARASTAATGTEMLQNSALWDKN